MAGPAEEVGKAASTFMESMKSQPLALALVVMNLGLLGLIYYVANTAAATRQREVALIYQQTEKVAQILSHCDK
jgi:hypothetical protein